MNWDLIEAVFDRGRGQSPGAREALLRGLAPEEAAEVRSLWASDDDAGSSWPSTCARDDHRQIVAQACTAEDCTLVQSASTSRSMSK
jgi:hypothetical protein